MSVSSLVQLQFAKYTQYIHLSQFCSTLPWKWIAGGSTYYTVPVGIWQRCGWVWISVTIHPPSQSSPINRNQGVIGLGEWPLVGLQIQVIT